MNAIRPVSDVDAALAMRSADDDAPALGSDRRVGGEGTSNIPPSISSALAAAAGDERRFEIACALIAADAGESRGDDHVPQGRLEHAIARALLHAWTHGQCSPEAVGSAYALVADRVARESPAH